MTQLKHLINSFSFGELGEELSGRSDLTEYQQGAKTLINFMPNQQGSISRRPSLEHVINIPTLDHDVITALPNEVIWSEITDKNIIGFESFSIYEVQSYVVAWDFKIGTTRYVVLANYSFDTGSVYVEYERVWTRELLAEDTVLNFFKLGNGAVITSQEGDIPPHFFTLKKIGPTINRLQFDIFENIFYGIGNRDSINSFTAGVIRSDYKFPLGIPFNPFSITGDTFEAINRVGNNEYDVNIEGLTSLDIGKCIRVIAGGVERLFFIFSTSSFAGANLKVYCINPSDNTGAIETSFETPTDNWALSTWGGNNGFPSAASYYQNRLILGGIPGVPSDVIWLSQTDDIYQFTQKRYTAAPSGDPIKSGYEGTVDPADAFSRVLDASDLDRVQWISAGKGLLVGTDVAEYEVFSVDGTYTASTVGTRKQSGHGGAPVNPIIIDGAVIFISGSGTYLREMRYSNEYQSYITDNLNKLNPGVIYRGREEEKISFVDMKFQGNRNTAWFLTSVGTIVTATIDLSNRIIAWSRFNSQYSFKGIDLISIDGVQKLAALTFDGSYFDLCIIDVFNNNRATNYCDSKKEFESTSTFNIPITIEDGEEFVYSLDGVQNKELASDIKMQVPERFNLPITGSGLVPSVNIYNTFNSTVAQTLWTVPYSVGSSVYVINLDETLLVDVNNQITTSLATTEILVGITIPVTDPNVGVDYVRIPDSDTFIKEGQGYTIDAFPNDSVYLPIKNGTILLNKVGSIAVGKRFKSEVETMPIDKVTQLGNTLGDLNKNPLVDVLTGRVDSFKVGASGTNNEFNYIPETYNKTGVHHVEVPNSADRGSTVKVSIDTMSPLDINGIKITGNTN